jgi:hypothetical protein
MCSRIWYEAGGRRCEAAVRPSPRAHIRAPRQQQPQHLRVIVARLGEASPRSARGKNRIVWSPIQPAIQPSAK